MKLPDLFLAIDLALASELCRWHNTQDSTLFYSVAMTSFALRQGHSCLDLNAARLEPPYAQLFNESPTTDWLNQLSAFDLSAESTSPIVLDHSRLYLRRYWQYETEIAQFVFERTQNPIELSDTQLATATSKLNALFPKASQHVDWQAIAAQNALANRFSVIIGGPGTGKTYTVTRLLALLASVSEHPLRIALAAPTGKAAQRLGESITQAKASLSPLVSEDTLNTIPDSAQTLHRLLGVIPDRHQFKHNSKRPIHADVLVIDEASMVDLPLMAKLLRAIPTECQLILLGDANQLPSVAAGSVLSNLTAKNDQKVTHCVSPVTFGVTNSPKNESPHFVTALTESRRFNDQSGIGALARSVITGDTKSAVNAFNDYSDIQWVNAHLADSALTTWVNDYFRPIAQAASLSEAFEQLKAFRILVANREGAMSVETLNPKISQMLGHSGSAFYKGRPIMVTQNHYGLGLFNGDIGLVWPDEHGHLMVWFEQPNGFRAVSLGRLPSIETVYAMTIHKTQGSEFDHVAMLLPEHHSPLLTRELLYTGLTRAKARFSCVGESDIFTAGIARKVTRWAGMNRH